MHVEMFTNMSSVHRNPNERLILFAWLAVLSSSQVYSLCPYDVCQYAMDCAGKTCVADGCHYSCVCDETSTSNECLHIANTTASLPGPGEGSTTQEQRSTNSCEATYEMRPEGERRCGFLFCVYGRCVDGKCECDVGSSGVLCESRCCKACSEHGICTVLSNTEETCYCHDNYTGQYCDIYSPSNGKLHLILPLNVGMG